MSPPMARILFKTLTIWLIWLIFLLINFSQSHGLNLDHGVDQPGTASSLLARRAHLQSIYPTSTYYDNYAYTPSSSCDSPPSPSVTPTNPPVSPHVTPPTNSFPPSISPSISPTNQPSNPSNNNPSGSPLKPPSSISPSIPPTIPSSPPFNPPMMSTPPPSASPSIIPPTTPSASPPVNPPLSTFPPSISPFTPPTIPSSPPFNPPMMSTPPSSISPSISPAIPSSPPFNPPMISTPPPSTSPSVTPPTIPSSPPFNPPLISTPPPSISPSIPPTIPSSPPLSPPVMSTPPPSISPSIPPTIPSIPPFNPPMISTPPPSSISPSIPPTIPSSPPLDPPVMSTPPPSISPSIPPVNPPMSAPPPSISPIPPTKNSTGLQVGFYKGLCPNKNLDVEAIITSKVQEHFRQDPTLLPALLRLQFHDCFVHGCDASILIDGPSTEKSAGPNLSVRGYEFIDDLKDAAEADCPGVVSCADIIAIATKELMKLGGGVQFSVQTGRRDGLVSKAQDVRLPSPFAPVRQSIVAFHAKKFTHEEMVVLLVGISNCVFFQDRLYQETSQFDPNMDPNLRQELMSTCPQETLSSNNNFTFLDQNPQSSNILDNSFFDQLIKQRGILPIDQELAHDIMTRGFVRQFARNGALFNARLATVMVKLQALEVLTGNQGQIRKVCSKVN